MEWLTHLLHAAAWTGGVILLFAIIGVIATIRWIIGLFWRGERAVAGEVTTVRDDFRKP
jgi:hypothetical protein